MVATFGIVRAAASTSAPAATQDFTLTGFGTPVAAMFFLSEATANDTDTADGVLCIGATDGTNERAATVSHRDGSANSVIYNRSWGSSGTQSGCCGSIAVNGTTVGLMSFNSWITDGVRVDILDQFTDAQIVTVLLIGGTEVNANVGSNATPTTINTSTTVTTVGFEADLVLTFNENRDFNDNNGTMMGFTVGAVWNDGGADPQTQACHQIWAETSAAASNVTGIVNTDRCGQLKHTTTIEGTCEMESFTASGFDLTLRDVDGDQVFMGWLALEFTNADQKPWVGVHTSPTSTGDSSVTITGDITPTFAMNIMGTIVTADSEVTNTEGGSMAIGLMTENEESSVAMCDDDGDATMDCSSRTGARAAISLLDDGTVAHQGDAAATRFANNAYTINYTTASTAYQWIGIAVGETTPAGGARRVMVVT